MELHWDSLIMSILAPDFRGTSVFYRHIRDRNAPVDFVHRVEESRILAEKSSKLACSNPGHNHEPLNGERRCLDL